MLLVFHSVLVLLHYIQLVEIGNIMHTEHKSEMAIVYLINQGISNSAGNTHEVRTRTSLFKNMLYQFSSSFVSAIHISYSA